MEQVLKIQWLYVVVYDMHEYDMHEYSSIVLEGGAEVKMGKPSTFSAQVLSLGRVTIPDDLRKLHGITKRCVVEMKILTVERLPMIVRLNQEGKTFEVLVNPEAALSYKAGESMSLSEVLVTPDVFSDLKKNIKPSEDVLLNAFGTADLFKVADEILKKGDLLVSEES